MALSAEFTKSKVASSAFWISASTLMARGLYLITSIIAARLLLPEDYGLIGEAATVSLFFQTTSANGIDSFIIYRQKLERPEVGTALLINGLMALVLAVGLILLSPLMAHFYHEQGLQAILFYSGLSLFMTIFGRVPRSILVKEMRQDIIAITDTVCNILNFLLIIILAYNGFQYLSYVIPTFITQTLNALIFSFYSRNFFSLAFQKDKIKDMFHYGKHFLPLSLISYLFMNADYMLGGLLLGSKLLGYYYFGFEKAFLVVILIKSISQQVFFPMFSKYQEDPDKLAESYFGYSSQVMFYLFPVIFLFLFCADQILPMLYGARWGNAMFTFQIILSYCFLKVNFDVAMTLFNAVGKPEQNIYHFLIITPLSILLYYIGITQASLMGLTIAAFLVHTLSTLLMMFRVQKIFSWSVGSQLAQVGKHLGIILISMPLLILLKWALINLGANHLVILTSISLAFVSSYLFLARIFYPDLLKDLIDFVNRCALSISNYRLQKT